jgi:hypothetical protein
MRIKQLDDVMKLVDDMPADRQLECVHYLIGEVEKWEERVSFNGTEWEFLLEKIKRRRERDAVGKKGMPPF